MVELSNSTFTIPFSSFLQQIWHQGHLPPAGKPLNFLLIPPIKQMCGNPVILKVLDFLEALDIDPNVEDQGKRGWRQIKMMFEDEDCLALQTLIDNQTITPAAQWTPSLVLKAIQ